MNPAPTTVEYASEPQLGPQRFSRSSKGDERRGVGHVEAHQGDIWVESEPGAGARFVIELPQGAGS